MSRTGALRLQQRDHALGQSFFPKHHGQVASRGDFLQDFQLTGDVDTRVAQH